MTGLREIAQGAKTILIAGHLRMVIALEPLPLPICI